MVTAKQVAAGIGDSIQKVGMPRMDKTRKIVIGTVYVLFANRVDVFSQTLAQSSTMKLLGVVSEDGEIDIDTLQPILSDQVRQNEKLELDIPFIGLLGFGPNDIDELFRYIRNRGAA